MTGSEEPYVNIAVTLNLYGHLMPGSETEAAGLLDIDLARSRWRVDCGAECGAGGRSPMLMRPPMSYI